MANKKISQLTERTKLTGNEMLPFQEGNYNGKIRSSLLTSLSGSGDDLQKLRSTKGQIVASYGNGIIRNVIHDNNQYYLKFDEPISYVVGDILNCTTYSENNKKNYSLVIQNIEKNYIIISESQYEQSKPQIGDETVQIGNTNNEKRAGIVTLTAAPNENIGLDCYSDIYTTNSDGQLRVRVGYLNGIYDSFFPEDGQPNGYGLYGNNCFLVGDFLLRDGSNITNLIEDLRFEISDIINETNALNNYLSNASFSNNLDKWQYGNNIKVFRVSQKLLYFNNNFYSNKETITALTKENNRNAVKLKNSYIMQYNTDYDRHPEFDEKVARLFNIQFRYKVLRPGILTICFKNENSNGFESYEKINYTQQLDETSVFRTLDISGKWNGTGDFYLSFTGEILIHSVILYDDDLGNLNEYINGQLQITNEKIQANYDKIIETSNKLEEYRSEFKLTAEELSVKFDHNISEINGKLEEYHSEFTLTAEQLEIKFDKKITDTKNSITSEYTSLIELTAENLRVEFGKKITNVKDEITEEYTSAINLSAQKLTVDFTKKITDSKEEITKEYTSSIELTAENLRVEFNKKITNTKNEITEEYTSAINLSAEELTVDFNKKITDAKQEITSEYTSAIELSAEELTITFDQKVTHLDETLEEYHSEFTLSAQEFTTRFEKNEQTITELEDTTTGLTQTTTNISSEVSEIKQNLNSITLRVSSTEQNIVTITDKTNNLEQTTAKQSEDISQIQIDLDNINLSVSSNTKEINTLKDTTTGLEQTTQTIQSQVSEINLDVDSILLRVSKTETNISNLENTTGSISSDVAQIKLDTEKIESNVTSISSKVDNNTGRIESLEAESAGWVTTAEGNTLWAAKGQTEEDIKTAKNAAESAAQAAAAATQKANSAQTAADSAQIAADDAASDAATASSKATSAQSTANSAYSLANSAYNKATSNATAISQTDEYISLISGNFDRYGNIINAAGWVTTSEGNTLWARKELENGNTIVSYINQTATTVEISAEKINFIGKTVINDKFIVDTAGNVTLNNLTANDGTFNGTIIATLGNIGAFKIDQYGLSDSDSSSPGAYISIGDSAGTKFFRVNSNLSSAMCAIRADNATALNITAYGSNGNGLRVLSNSAGLGYAINSHGNVLLEARNGEFIKIYGLTVNVVSITSSQKLYTYYDYIECNNSSAITLTLPTPSSSEGKIFMFNFLKTSGVTLSGTLKLFNNTVKYSHKWTTIGKRIFISNGTYWVEYMYYDN